jgi:glycerol-1-phosphatase
MRLADGYDALLFDLDGVLFRGDSTVEGAPETLAALRSDGHRIAFVTNNSARTPEQVATKLAGHGFVADPAEVVTSALATGDLLAGRAGSVYVVGERGIRDALSQAGLEVLEGEPEAADVVVVGWDREVTYAKLRRACLLVQRGARLVATNADRSFPAPDGFWPGAGAILSVITTTTGLEAEIVGKPHAPLYLAALRRTGGEHPLVIGDRIETDIAGAGALGWDSLLVLSGVAVLADLDRSPVRPTYVAQDVRALLGDPADLSRGTRGGPRRDGSSGPEGYPVDGPVREG